MKIISKLVFIILLFALSLGADSKLGQTVSGFPDKPVKIIVYTGPGGLIDVTARKFTDIASKYSDVTFVVENKPGAGGIVALKKVLQLPADGYTLYACTKSNISKFVSSGGTLPSESLDWIALLMADPECVITTNSSGISSWEDILNNAQKINKEQIWVGPATGGLDHVTALKIWDKFGIKAKWIPYKSGGKARAALLGAQGVAYVGNPREVLGNPDLHIAAVSAQKRLERFPDVPILSEFDNLAKSQEMNLDFEYMWRGFAIKKGVDPELLNWYKQLFQKVTDDPEWREFWEKGGIDVVYYGPEKFTEIVKQDEETFKYYLQKLGILKDSDANLVTRIVSGRNLTFIVIFLLILMFLIGFLVNKSRYSYLKDKILIITGFIFLSLLFYLISFIFPESGAVGPAVVPRLWIFALIPLNIILLITTVKNEVKSDDKLNSGNRVIVYQMIAVLATYLLSIYFIGYFISSALFVAATLNLLGYKEKLKIIYISLGWVLFSWLVFYKLLYVPLPLGLLIELL